MLAAIDISNTRVAVGLFDAAELRAGCAFAADARRTVDEYSVLLAGYLREAGLAREQIDGAVVSSVGPPLTDVLEQVCRRLFGVQPLLVGTATRSGMRIVTQNPREVGADRIANALAVQALYGSPAIVVDLDTATAFDVVSADGAYLGSVLAPGLALGADALAQHTSRLQRVQLVRPKTVIGRDSIAAVQSGVIYGHIAMIEGIVARIRAELRASAAPVIATGELAPLLAAETRTIDHVEPSLTLIGLRLFYERNLTG